MKSNRVLTPLQKYKKRFHIILVAFVFSITVLCLIIYNNYDYLVFKYFITYNYIYTDDLDTLYSNELNIDANGEYLRYFDNIAISAVTRSIRAVNNDKYTFLYIPQQYENKKDAEKAEAQDTHTAELNPSVIYFKLSNFSTYSLDIFRNELENLKSYDNIIIDLRYNRGGEISVMKKITEQFLEKGSIIAKDDMRIIDITYKSKKNKPLSYDNIIILQNSSTASASENMIAALDYNLENVTLIGDTTFGKGIGQYTLPLKRGFAVKATILLWHSPSGENYQGIGIKPDIEFLDEDIISFALEHIGK